MDINVPALFFDRKDNKYVQCNLCPHNCVIRPDGLGACRARKNTEGELYSLNYSRITSLSLDHIEKKPLYHFHPGSMILSAGTFGCNFKCPFCQNWSIAQKDANTVEILPEMLAAKAEKMVKDGNIGIAYTYNEPSIWYEYVCDTSRLAKEKGLCNVLVTNGFINREPLEQLLPYIDAMNIDVKAFTESFYEGICKGGLKSVMNTVETAADRCHVEVTTLVIPGLNDTMEEIGRLADWLADISPGIPLHLSRFFQEYKMYDKLPTPVKTLEMARDRALKNLEYVYIGNVW